MARDSASSPKGTYAASKPHFVKGETLNALWDAIRASRPVGGKGTTTRQTTDGTMVELSQEVLDSLASGGSGSGTLRGKMWAISGSGGVLNTTATSYILVRSEGDGPTALISSMDEGRGRFRHRWSRNGAVLWNQDPNDPDTYIYSNGILWIPGNEANSGLYQLRVSDDYGYLDFQVTLVYTDA